MKVLYTLLDHHRTHIARLPTLSPIPSAEPSNSVSRLPARPSAKNFTRINSRPVAEDPKCREPGRLRDHVTGVLTDLPIVGHPTRLHLRLSRFTCNDPGCDVTVFRQRIDRVAAPKAAITRRTTRWILHCLAVDKMSVSAVARALGVGWDAVDALAISAVKHLVHEQSEHLNGVRILGVDEHKWKHVRGHGDPSFVSIIVDLTPAIDGTGPARLLDMISGRSAVAFSGWLRERDQAFRDRAKIVSMDGFAGCPRQRRTHCRRHGR